jgi:hypothetical protein
VWRLNANGKWTGKCALFCLEVEKFSPMASKIPPKIEAMRFKMDCTHEKTIVQMLLKDPSIERKIPYSFPKNKFIPQNTTEYWLHLSYFPIII